MCQATWLSAGEGGRGGEGAGTVRRPPVVPEPLPSFPHPFCASRNVRIDPLPSTWLCECKSAHGPRHPERGARPGRGQGATFPLRRGSERY